LVKKISDEKIIDLLNSESTYEAGFSMLMQTYQERLYWHIRRMVFDHEDANDVIQNTFVKVFRSWHTFQGRSKLYTWLYRIATNESITFLNQKKRKSTTSIDNEETDLANRLEADTYFDGDEAQMKLQIALGHLPPKQRLVFSMRYYEEMPYNEMSEILETSVGALKASYHHAVKKIEIHLRSGSR